MKQQINYIVLPESNLVVCELQDRYGNRYRGKAKCSGGDVFDEEKGKRIAYLRADNKRKRASIRFLNDYIINELEFQISYMQQQIAKYKKCIDNTRIAVSKNNQEIGQLS
jgi:hypothetical protein